MTQGKLLIVDDELSVRDSLAKWFTEEGYEVATAENANEALTRVAEQTFEVALVDIKMRGTDGIELQRRLHELDPELIVIMMTGYASVETAVTARTKAIVPVHLYGLPARRPEARSEATPGAAPSRKRRKLRRAHRAARGGMRSTPVTGSLMLQPCRRAAQTTPVPSARHRSADSSTRANSESPPARITNSGLTVATRCLPPPSTSASIRPSAASMSMQSTRTPSTLTSCTG